MRSQLEQFKSSKVCVRGLSVFLLYLPYLVKLAALLNTVGNGMYSLYFFVTHGKKLDFEVVATCCYYLMDWLDPDWKREWPLMRHPP